MTVLVTGGTGFVGLNLLNELADRDERVIVLSRNGSATGSVPAAIEMVTGDIQKPESFADALGESDCVVHLAALLGGDEAMINAVNVEGTISLVEECARRGVERFIFTSTIRSNPNVPIEPKGAYERSKIRAEERILETDAPFDLLVVYPTYVFGPRDYRLTRYDYFRMALSNPVLVPPLYLNRSYNIVHVGDVVAALVAGIDGRKKEGRTVVTGENRSAASFHRAVSAEVDGAFVLPVPETVTKHAIVPVINALHEWGVSPVQGELFTGKRNVGTVPRRFQNRTPTDEYGFEAAIRDTADWYRSVGLL